MVHIYDANVLYYNISNQSLSDSGVIYIITSATLPTWALRKKLHVGVGVRVRPPFSLRRQTETGGIISPTGEVDPEPVGGAEEDREEQVGDGGVHEAGVKDRAGAAGNVGRCAPTQWACLGNGFVMAKTGT